MSYILPPQAVPVPADTTGMIPGPTIQLNIPGDLATVSYVKIANETPMALQLTGFGSGGVWLDSYTVDAFPVPGLSTPIYATPYNILGVSASNTPVSFILVTWYLPNEQPPGTYPISLQRLTNVGNSLVTNTSAANAFEQDFLTPFVLTGLVSTRDGSVANQLDTTSGIAFLIQADSSLGRVAPLASTHLTSASSSTYFLDLNPNGSYSFATSHSGVSNHLPIAQVATDGSGNISTVTDARTLNSTMLSAMLGALTLPTVNSIRLQTASGSLFTYFGGGNATQVWTPQVGAAQWLEFVTWDGSATHVPLGIGSAAAGLALAYVDDTGAIFWSNSTAHLAYFGGGNATQYWTPQSGAAQWHEFVVWNGSSTLVPFGIGSESGVIGSARTWLADGGGLGALGGQATAGGFGAPVIVAQADGLAVGVSTLVTVCSFTPPTAGLYRVNFWGHIGQNSPSVSAYIHWTNAVTGTLFSHNFDLEIAGTFTQLNAISVGANTDVLAFSMVVRAASSGPITIFYQNTVATPVDSVSGMIERLT